MSIYGVIRPQWVNLGQGSEIDITVLGQPLNVAQRRDYLYAKDVY